LYFKEQLQGLYLTSKGRNSAERFVPEAYSALSVLNS